MAKKKAPRNTARRQKPVMQKRGPAMNLCEIGERIELAKKEIRDALRRLEQERVAGGIEGAKDREKAELEAVLVELDKLIHPMPPIHNFC